MTIEKRVAIIGGGNLGTAIADGLLASNFCSAAAITLTRRNTDQLEAYAKKGVIVSSDNLAAVKNAGIIIIAVKPFQIAEVIASFKSVLTSDYIVVSVVTGVSLQELRGLIEKDIPLFRAMPNTAIAIQQSMTCISHQQASTAQVQYVSSIFNLLGKVAIINDGLMDAATVLGACGTAFAMRYIRANIQGGIEIGFDSETASTIAAQTVKGAADLLLIRGTHPEQEIDKVTTPKGCTIAGLNEMEHRGFSSSLIKGIASSFNKIAKH